MIYKSILVAIGLSTTLLPHAVLAAEESYLPLVNIPGVTDPNNFNDYLNALYALSISIAALIAVVKIVIAGAEYMLDDIVTHKTEAKAEIKSSLIGLLIIIGAVVILNTINTDLTHMTILDNTDHVTVDDHVVTNFKDCKQEGSNCSKVPCTQLNSESWKYITDPNNLGLSCEKSCDNLDSGAYVDGGDCYYDPAALSKLQNDYMSQLTIDQCKNKTNCEAAYCISTGLTGNGGTIVGGITGMYAAMCKPQCLNDRKGTFVDPNTGICVFSSQTYLSEEECSKHSRDGFAWSGGTCKKYSTSKNISCSIQVEQVCTDLGVCTDGATVSDCTSATASCTSQNGQSVPNAAGDAIVCYFP
jgi:Type IV secretion system pilin